MPVTWFERAPRLVGLSAMAGLGVALAMVGVRLLDEDRTEPWVSRVAATMVVVAGLLLVSRLERKLQPGKVRLLGDRYDDLRDSAATLIGSFAVTLIAFNLSATGPRGSVPVPVVSSSVGTMVFSGSVLFSAVAVTIWIRSSQRRRARQHVWSEDIAEWPLPGGLGERERQDAAKAYQDWRDAVRMDAVLPIVRQQIQVGRRRSLATELPAMSWSGLHETFDATQYVRGETLARIDRIIAQRMSGSIGISGMRGIGKTSLLKVLENRGTPAGSVVTVLTQAPTDFDNREFLLTLLAQICQKFGASATGLKDLTARSVLGRFDAFVSRGSDAAGPVVLLAVVAAAIAAARVDDKKVATYVVNVAPWVVGLIAAVLLWFYLVYPLLAKRLHIAEAQPSTFAREAQALLDKIQYQLTETTGADGVFSVGGVKLTAKLSRQRARTAMTYPDVVTEFRGFVGAAGRHLVGRHGTGARIVICIDELDKVGSLEAMQKLLNGIGAVFDIPRCHFLVAVSEDALASFDLRGVASRTSLDALFDEVISIPRPHFEISRSILAQRCSPLPEVFSALCHALAGGNPRDLVRTARRMYVISDEGALAIDAVARDLIREDMKVVMAAQLVQLREFPKNSRDLSLWVGQINIAEASVDQLEQACGSVDLHLGSLDAEGLALIAGRICAYLYYATTMLRIFGRPPAATASRLAADLPAFLQIAETFSMARAWLSIEPAITWREVDRLRTGELAPIQRPELLMTSGEAQARNPRIPRPRPPVEP
jgi:hypothetical protein